MAQFIFKQAKFKGLRIVTADLLAKVEEDDVGNIPKLFSWIIQLPLSMAFPP